MRKLVVLIVMVLIASPGLSRAGEGTGGAGSEATTVKSGKSNSSDRVGGGSEGMAPGTTVKGSKSNSSERAGAAAGGDGAVQGTTVKSSKSNSSE